MKIQVVIEATSIHEYLEAVQALAAGYTVAPQPNMVEALKATGEAAKAVTTGGTITGLSDAEESKPAETEVKYISRKVAARLSKKIEQNLDQEDQHRLFESFNIVSVTGLPAEEVKAFEALMDSFIKAAKEIEQEEADKPKEVEQVHNDDKEESTEPKHGFPAVKAIAMKLNKIQDGKAEVKFLLDKFGAAKLSDLQEENYDEFHELASKAIADHDSTPKQSGDDNAESNKQVETKEDTATDNGEKEVTLPMIRGIAKQLADQGFKDEIRQVLKDHDAASLTKINKKDYQSVYDALVAFNG